MANLGSIQANAIANQMRVKEGIMPVQAQSLSAAATPKELITDSLNLKKEPFYSFNFSSYNNSKVVYFFMFLKIPTCFIKKLLNIS